MKMSKTKKKFILWLTIIMIAFGTLTYGVIQNYFPEHYFAWYPAIPLFFYLFGWYYIFTFDKCRRQKRDKILTLYLGMKVVKMLLAVVIIFFYMVFVSIHKSDFIIIFFLFYLFSLIYETYFFYHFEYNKNVKQKKTNE